MELAYYEHGGVGLRVRRGARREWDEIITRECQFHYEHAALDLSQQTFIVDIGANIGAYALWCLKHNPDAKILACDMDVANSAVGRLNLAGLADYEHVRVGYTEGDYVVHNLPDVGGYARVIPAAQAPANERVIVSPLEAQTRSLESLLDEYGFPHIDVLKLDCESAEYDIIPNMELETLVNCRFIVGEYHDGIERFEGEILNPILKEHFEILSLNRAPDWGRFVLRRWGVK